MMAYYAVIALFPMLVFVLSLALLVIPDDTVREGLAMASATLPPSVRDVIATRVDALLDASGAGFAILGAVLALWGASRGALALMTALNTTSARRRRGRGCAGRSRRLSSRSAVAVLAVLALGLLVIGPRDRPLGSEIDSGSATRSTSRGASAAGSARACSS